MTLAGGSATAITASGAGANAVIAASDGNGITITSVNGSTLNNAGVIGINNSGFAVAANGGPLRINNTGTLTSDIRFTGGNDVVNNTGTFVVGPNPDFGALSFDGGAHIDGSGRAQNQACGARLRHRIQACFYDRPRIMNHYLPEGEKAAARQEPDAHGQAALLLAESILYALVETNTLSLAAALSVIQTTCEVKIEVAEREGESSQRMHESLGLLMAMSKSFAADAQ